MSLLDWFDPNFLHQIRFFRPHKVNGKWYFLKRDIVLPHTYWPVLENRLQGILRRPPVMALPFVWMWKSAVFRRMHQANLDLVFNRLTPRGSCITDFVGDQRRKIRYTLIQKNRDPYVHMLVNARNLRGRQFRVYGWSVPPRHGPGAGFGYVPRHLDYANKIARMIDDDYCDTAVQIFAGRMFPVLCMRKYFNELPRPTPFWYGLEYTREQMYNHLTWGIDPGTVIAEQEAQNPDPAKDQALKDEREYVEYLFPELSLTTKPDYKLKWPFPDDNVYRPIYNRGFNRKYWCRIPY